jgi:hypothetical protein
VYKAIEAPGTLQRWRRKTVGAATESRQKQDLFPRAGDFPAVPPVGNFLPFAFSCRRGGYRAWKPRPAGRAGADEPGARALFSGNSCFIHVL